VNVHRADPLAQSVHDRLLKLAAVRKEDFNVILSQYGVERLLYRLTRTAHKRRFILKGAAMFVLWFGRVHRPTRDLDLLGSGRLNTRSVRSIFREVCQACVEPDGLIFDPASVTAGDIRQGQEYQGLRVRVRGLLGSARISVQVDIGLGDAVTPQPDEATYPTLLDMPAPRLKVYPRETAIAEKLDAILRLGLKNSRMKDYYDICTLCRCFPFDGATLAHAVRATLNRRGQVIPLELPIGLADSFASDPGKARQWGAYLGTHRSLEVPGDWAPAVRQVREFLQPILAAIASGQETTLIWVPPGPWRIR
jgi:predicted nucleotidyltransferase component of viral defense system